MSSVFNPKVFEDVEEGHKGGRKSLTRFFLSNPNGLKGFPLSRTGRSRESIPLKTSGIPILQMILVFPASTPLPGVSSHLCTGDVSGPCVCLQVWEVPGIQISVFIFW